MVNKFIESIIEILGEYTPVTYTEYKLIGEEIIEYEVVAGGFAGINYPWIVGAIIFIMMLYLTYRIFYLFIPKIHRYKWKEKGAWVQWEHY